MPFRIDQSGFFWGGGAAPDTLDIDIDFTTGTYLLDGVSVGIAAVLSGYDGADIDSTGSAMWYTNANRPEFIGAVLDGIYDFMVEGITVMFEVDWDGASDEGPLLILSDDADPSIANTGYIEISIDDGALSLSDFDSLNQDATTSFHNSHGVVRYALTILRPDSGVFKSEYSISGSPAEDFGLDTAYSAQANFPSVEGGPLGASDPFAWAFNTLKIRKVKIQKAVTPAELSILAADGLPLAIRGTPVTRASDGIIPYTGFSVAGSGGLPPYTYSVQTGSLPTGLTLNSSTGAISGTASGASETGIVIRVTDDAAATEDLASFDIDVYPQWAILTDTAQGSGTSPVTLTAMDLGPTHASRVYAVLLASENNNAHNVDTVTVDGNSATLVARTTGTLNAAAIYKVALAAGSSGDVVVAFTGTISGLSVNVGLVAMYGVTDTVNDSDTDTGTGTTRSDSVNTLTDGITVGVLSAISGAGVTWSGLDEQYDNNTAFLKSFAFSLDTASTSLSVTATMTSTTAAMALASFSP